MFELGNAVIMLSSVLTDLIGSRIMVTEDRVLKFSLSLGKDQ
jgi:hypothetical protein